MEIAIPWYLDTPLGTLTFVRSGDGIRIQQVQNMDGAQLRAASEMLPAWDGAIIYDSFRGGRFPVLSGIIKATEGDPTTMLQRRRQYEDTLRAYTDSLTRADGTLRFVPTGAGERQLTVRLLDAIQIQGVGILKEWQVSFQAGDPLIYSTASHSVDTGTVGAASGTETFPYGYPAGFGVTSSAAPGVATNAGTAPTWPVFRIYGPANSPAVQLVETGESFVLMGLAIASGHYVEVDVRNNAVTLDGEADQSLVSYLDPATARLPKLQVGTNTINFYGGTIASAAKVTTIWKDGYV